MTETMAMPLTRSLTSSEGTARQLEQGDNLVDFPNVVGNASGYRRGPRMRGHRPAGQHPAMSPEGVTPGDGEVLPTRRRAGR